MELLNNYNAETILSEELFTEIFEEEDQIQQARMLLSCQDRAKELGVKGKFDALVKAYQKTFKDIAKEKAKEHSSVVGYTDFIIPIDSDYDNMKCGQWVADERGVVSYNVMGMEQRACHHPIFPVRRLTNVQTNEEKITLAYKRDFKWKEITIDKDVMSSASKIVGLSKYGIAVTSENAKYMVRYLSDVECLNSDVIEVNNSTSKLGWHGNDFIPYDNEIVFDGDLRFKQLFESISTNGSEVVWLDHVRELRATGKPEIKFMLAASFASVLIKPLGCLPFFVDLWGETEGGKSVSLMLAASVWANPNESQYIGDYKSTDVALEVRADMLNNLPMLLDDTSNATKRIVEDFENIIYRLCSGKGKSRSNKELGASKENNWKCCFITNGERPLSGYVNQGGAINRIIEIEAGSKIYNNPQETANILKMNYGFVGRRFVEEVKKIDNLQERYQAICQKLFDEDKMQKQAMSLACIILADQIATETIFKDNANITLDEAKELLISRNELSENERCYRYLLDQIAMNSFRFEANCQTEHWGIIEHGYASIYPTVFDRLCSSAGYSKKSFISWAKKHNVVELDGKGNLKQKKIDGKNVRAITIKLDDGVSVDENGFIQVDEQEKLPFD